MRAMIFCLSLWLTATPAIAQNTLGLVAPGAVTDSGLLKYILPRFSLKTGIRIQPGAVGAMVLATEPPGTPVFRRDAQTYYLRITDDPRQQRFLDWLVSDVGKRTVTTFKPASGAPFSGDVATKVAEAAPEISGDAKRGGKLALKHCGRCHVVGEINRKKGIGSTPSFAVLRGLHNWESRFQAFFALNPHPAFTQVTDVTAPFSPEYPPPIVPVIITLDELEAILAFVAATQAADLGAPLQFQ